MRTPPLGVMPKWRWDEIRATELAQAIDRFLEAKQPIKIEWVEEYNELITKERKE